MRSVAVVLLLLATGCANYRSFAPRENQNGSGPDGSPAAVYPVGVPQVGELRVWSSGTRMVEDGDADVVELRVGFELENTGSDVLTIDPASVQCERLRVRDHELANVAPARVEGTTEARPGSSARYAVAFRPEGAEGARDVEDFALRFRVLANGNPVLVQVTPFGPYIPDDRWRDDRWYWGHSYYCGPTFGFGFHRSFWW